LTKQKIQDITLLILTKLIGILDAMKPPT
jgi:hypothetical protein